MDVRSNRPVFGVDLEALKAPQTALESAQPEAPERPRNPAQEFRKLPAPTGAFPFHLHLGDVLEASAVQQIEAAGKLVCHIIGDTGQKSHGGAAQEAVAEHLGRDARLALGDDRARFAYHLGDVVYFYGERPSYQQQFYDPYKNYPPPIFAIPGNHDGDVVRGDRPLEGFVNNFCAAQSVHSDLAGEATRTTMTQPNCYWTLRAPFVRIIGLYSNVPGQLDDNNTTQYDWLVRELRDSAPDRCVIVAVHHVPYSRDTSHGGYRAIADALDRAFREAGRYPHLVLSGHVHNYQRFERDLRPAFAVARKLAYVVVGASGYAGFDALHQVDEGIPLPAGVVAGPYVDTLPGFLRLEVSAGAIRGRYFAVPRPPHHLRGPVELKDEFHIPLA